MPRCKIHGVDHSIEEGWSGVTCHIDGREAVDADTGEKHTLIHIQLTSVLPVPKDAIEGEMTKAKLTTWLEPVGEELRAVLQKYFGDIGQPATAADAGKNLIGSDHEIGAPEMPPHIRGLLQVLQAMAEARGGPKVRVIRGPDDLDDFLDLPKPVDPKDIN